MKNKGKLLLFTALENFNYKPELIYLKYANEYVGQADF